jgi:hypothetical protein
MIYFIDGVVDDFLDQDINPVVRRATVSELSDIHSGPQPDMFLPVQG